MSKKIIQDIYYLQMLNLFLVQAVLEERWPLTTTLQYFLLCFLKDHQVRIEMEKLKNNFCIAVIRYHTFF